MHMHDGVDVGDNVLVYEAQHGRGGQLDSPQLPAQSLLHEQAWPGAESGWSTQRQSTAGDPPSGPAPPAVVPPALVVPAAPPVAPVAPESVPRSGAPPAPGSDGAAAAQCKVIPKASGHNDAARARSVMP